jgi:hypothetical protein
MGMRFGAAGVAVAVVVLAVGVVGSAAGAAGGGGSKQRTIRVLAEITEVDRLDLGATGNSLGDEIVFSNRLLKGDKEVGHEGAVCTTVSVQRNEAQCIATFDFGNGQITGQALVRLGDPTPYDVAVTGGSGRYEGVEGEIRVTPISDTRGRHTFHLED